MGNFISNIASGVGDFVDGITGKAASDAAEDSAQLQYDATMAGIDFQKEALAQQIELNQPYLDLGTESIEGFRNALVTPDHYTAFQNDPTGYSFLEGNPMFQAAVDHSGRQLKNAGAAQGRLNSGGMVDQLFQNYLATGDQYWGNYLNRGEALTTGNINRAAMPINLGQSSANFQAANIGNTANAVTELTAQGANALGAGQVGSANAQGQGAQNLINLGLMAYGLSGGLSGGKPNAFGGWNGSLGGY